MSSLNARSTSLPCLWAWRPWMWARSRLFRSVECTRPLTSTPSCCSQLVYRSVSSASLNTTGVSDSKVRPSSIYATSCAKVMPWKIFSSSSFLTSCNRLAHTASREIKSPALNLARSLVSSKRRAHSRTLESILSAEAWCKRSVLCSQKIQLWSNLAGDGVHQSFSLYASQ